MLLKDLFKKYARTIAGWATFILPTAAALKFNPIIAFPVGAGCGTFSYFAFKERNSGDGYCNAVVATAAAFELIAAVGIMDNRADLDLSLKLNPLPSIVIPAVAPVSSLRMAERVRALVL